MVFCGKPSGGCFACRERKTRCDQIPEGCTQCRRAKRKCPGYRLQGDLIFRDSTTTVIKKAKARAAKEKKALKEPRSSLVPSEPFLEIVQQEESPLSIYNLAPTLEERAVGYFIANYVVNMNGPSKGHMDYLVDVTRTQGVDEWLECSMKAVGLAAYAHAVHAPSLTQNARYQYIRAIQATNKALRDPVNVKKDSTLVSIMILGIFETVTGMSPRSIRDWAEHLNGAAAVIKIRGPEQLKTIAGRRMLVQITSHLLATRIQRGVRLQKHMEDYMNLAYKLVKKPEPPFVLLHTMMRLAALRADVINHTVTDRQEIINRSLELDGILLGMQTTIPQGWEFETVKTDVFSPHVFNGHYHIYQNFWMAQMWNGLRTMRIILNEMIRTMLLEGWTCKPPLFKQPEYAAQYQVSSDVRYEAQLGILYSVPQHLGFPGDNPQSAVSKFHDSKIPMTGVYNLIWPLWVAGVMDIDIEEIRTFVISNFQYIVELTGINQARVMANMMIARNFDEVNSTIWKDFGKSKQNELVAVK